MRFTEMSRAPLMAVVMITIGVAAPAAQSTPAPRDGADFSADVVVTRAVVDERGTLLRELPSSRYRLTRFADGRLRMTMLPPAGVPPAPEGVPDPFAGMTVEADPGSGALDVRDRQGRPVSLGAGNGGWVSPEAPLDAVLPAVAAHPTRKADLERRFGRSRGRVRGLDRYLGRDGSRVEELLVHPESALPAEMNVVDGGTLLERHRFDYQRSGDAWLRRRTASETAVPGAPGQRLLSVSTLDDVRTAGGAR